MDALLDEVLKEDGTGPFAGLRGMVDRSVLDAGELSTFDLPKNLRADAFGTLTPEVIRATRELDTRVIRGIANEVRATIKQHVGRGMEQGLAPATIARGAREMLDLAPTQEAAVANFRRMLEEGDREALTRALRDRRFDKVLRTAFGNRGGDTVAFHGASTRFTRFDEARIGSTTDAGFLGRGFYFSTDPAIGAGSPVTLKVRLDTGNQLRISFPDWGASKQRLVRSALGLPDTASPADVSSVLRARGYDSVVLDYSPTGYKHQEIMVLRADNISIGGGLTTAQVDHMTSAYQRRMVAFNAETHARTIALDANRAGQRLAWQDAIDRGVVEGSKLKRRWVTVGDTRVRPEHRELNGTTIGFYDTYPNGETVPGESTYNCRCIERVFVERAT